MINNRKWGTLTLLLMGFVTIFIYLFYRLDNIPIYQVFNIFIPKLKELKVGLSQSIPLNDFIIYSLPEGLWVFGLTFFIRGIQIQQIKINFSLIPMLYCIVLEIMQYFNLTNGTFDSNDIISALSFGILAFWLTQNETRSTSIKEIRIVAPFVIGFLALFLGNI